jgi:hypothetical protein
MIFTIKNIITSLQPRNLMQMHYIHKGMNFISSLHKVGTIAEGIPESDQYQSRLLSLAAVQKV